LSRKVFLPVAVLLLMSIQSGAFTDSGDSSGVGNPVKESINKQLNILKSVGLLKPQKLNQVQEETQPENGLGPAPSGVAVRFSGYVRSFTQYRVMDKFYPDMYGGARNIAFNGINPISTNQDGFPEPFLMLKAEANPTSKTSVVVEYYFDNQLTGQRLDSGRQALLYRLFNFKGNIYSKFGTFTLTAGGGVNWAKMTPFTLWNYQYREDLFERWPWQPEGSSAARFLSHYEEKNIAVDNRWGRAGTQGFILEGTGLPAGFGFMGVYGKTDNSGGFRSYVQTTNSPIKNFWATRIYNTALGHEIGINYFEQFGYTNAQQLKPESQKIATFDIKFRPKNFNIYFEAGAGSYLSPDYKEKWSEALNLKVDIDKKLIYFPLSVQVYSVGASVVNVNSNVANSSIPYVQPSYPTPDKLFGSTDVTTFPGIMTELGQMANNRRGVNLQGSTNIGKLKIAVGYATSQEIDNYARDTVAFNQIAFQHRLNAFPRSRFGGNTGLFQNNIGPYNNLMGMYRRTFERVQITDDPASVDYKKSFNLLDLSLKYKLSLFKRDLILMSYSTLNSAQDVFSFIPVFSDQAFVRYFYQEFNGFYPIHKKVTLVAFGGYETTQANKRTSVVDANGDLVPVQQLRNEINAAKNKFDVDRNNADNPLTEAQIAQRQLEIEALQSDLDFKIATGKSRDQIGVGYGLGFDYDFAQRAVLSFRHRWFEHRDKNFIKDEFRGQESSLELKIFF
jgi:hypothetical protein